MKNRVTGKSCEHNVRKSAFTSWYQDQIKSFGQRTRDTQIMAEHRIGYRFKGVRKEK